MNFLNFLKDKITYLIFNILILIVGYIFIHKGVDFDATEKVKSGIFISIGTSLIAAGIVILLDLWKNISITEQLVKFNNVISGAGIQLVYKNRAIPKYQELMEQLDSELDIAGYSLGAFFDSFSDLLIEKLKNGNMTVRVLFVNPDIIHSSKRANIEGRNPEQFRDKINTFRTFFSGTNGMEIKFIDAPLSTMIFRIDKIMFVGPHFYNRQSKATPTQELKSNHWLFDEYQNEFERMWKDAVSV